MFQCDSLLLIHQVLFLFWQRIQVLLAFLFIVNTSVWIWQIFKDFLRTIGTMLSLTT